MTSHDILGCVIEYESATSRTKVRHRGQKCAINDENRYSASSRAKKWNFTAVVVVVGHVIHPTPTIQQLGT